MRLSGQSSQAAGAYRPAGGATLDIRCFEGEFVVYNPLSGHTHYLDVVSGQVLRLVASGVSDAGAIGARIAAFLGVDADDRVAALVDQTLMKLEEVKLIEGHAQERRGRQR